MGKMGLGALDNFRGLGARNIGRARRRYSRREWFRTRSTDEPGALGYDAPLRGSSDDGDPPVLPGRL